MRDSCTCESMWAKRSKFRGLGLEGITGLENFRQPSAPLFQLPDRVPRVTGQKGAAPVANFHDMLNFERSDGLSERHPAYLEVRRERPFRRKLVARFETSVVNVLD